MKRVRILILCMCIVMSVLLTGCGKEKKKEQIPTDPTVVFQYGDAAVTKGEVYIYINTIKERYEAQYGENVWELHLPESQPEDGLSSMVDLTKQQVVNEIVKVKTLSAQAKDFNIKISDSKKTEIEAEAATFYNGLTDQDKNELELTLETVIMVMEENTLARMVQDELLHDNPVEISDEEARMTTFYDMYFHCYDVDANGVITPYDQERKSQQYENALQACSTLATAIIDENEEAENIENLADYYQLTMSAEYTLTPAEVFETYGEDIYNQLYSMENGDYSTVIESEYGYHVFQMLALTDAKATKAKKDVMTEAAIDEFLQESMEDWRKEIDPEFSYPESINMEVYDTIKIR